MNYIKRFLYLLYYLKGSDYKQLSAFSVYASFVTGRSRWRIIGDCVFSVFKYNISLKDYFCFRFFELKVDQRFNWAGSGFMYEYQLRMNPKGVRNVLKDKIQFLYHFRTFVKREIGTLDEIKANMLLAEKMLANSSGHLVLKDSYGQVGAEVEVISCDDFSPLSLIDYMVKRNFNLLEEYVIQHPTIMALSASGVNTVRVITQLYNEDIHILGARFRISVNSPVDNMGAGNLAAPVDIESGTICGPGVYSDITKEDRDIHPITGMDIIGFKIPHWDRVIDLAKKVALISPENKSVGWDIAITEDGPELIEGNHNWCKLLWQLPVKHGLKRELDKYL